MRGHQVCCEDSPNKGLFDHRQFDDLNFHSRLQVHLKLDYFFKLQYLGQCLSYYYIQTWHDGRLMATIYAHARLDDLDLVQGHSGSAKTNNQRCMLWATKQAISIFK